MEAWFIEAAKQFPWAAIVLLIWHLTKLERREWREWFEQRDKAMLEVLWEVRGALTENARALGENSASIQNCPAHEVYPHNGASSERR